MGERLRLRRGARGQKLSLLVLRSCLALCLHLPLLLPLLVRQGRMQRLGAPRVYPGHTRGKGCRPREGQKGGVYRRRT